MASLLANSIFVATRTYQSSDWTPDRHDAPARVRPMTAEGKSTTEDQR